MQLPFALQTFDRCWLAGYPSDADFAAWRAHGNIVLLRSEVMLWKDWNLGFEPRLGPDEFARVGTAAHAQGQRFIVYTSPYYFLRYFVSGYDVHNSVGVLCLNGPPGIQTDLAERLLQVNGRLHVLAGWEGDEGSLAIYQTAYAARLTPALRLEVDGAVAQRQAEVAAKAAARAAEQAGLTAPPQWGPPARVVDFAALPAGQSVVSPANEAAFALVNGALEITAHASTYAYLELPLTQPAAGVVVKLRRDSDGGMSWGPAVALRWTDGSLLRLGVRSDGQLQSDVLGQQALFSTCGADEWVWLRARWLARAGVIERSLDGATWQAVSHFEHGGKCTGQPVALLVGKVPYNGQPVDHTVPGEVGQCRFGRVEVYGR